jgi:hypothetical protein
VALPADIAAAQVDALAAVLAESMTIPDVERDALLRRRHSPIEAGGNGAGPEETNGSGAATCDPE